MSSKSSDKRGEGRGCKETLHLFNESVVVAEDPDSAMNQHIESHNETKKQIIDFFKVLFHKKLLLHLTNRSTIKGNCHNSLFL